MPKRTIDIPAGSRSQEADDLVSSVFAKVRDKQSVEYELADDGSYTLTIKGSPEVANATNKKVKDSPAT